MGFVKVMRSDAEYYYSLSSSPIASMWILKSLFNPSLRAAALFRLCASSSGARYLMLRSILMAFHSCDVASGVEFGSSIYLPHPLGIVIGRGSVVGDRVWIFQNVTLGRDGAGGYPIIGDGARLFTGCVVVGNVLVEPGQSVAALSFISRN